MARLENKQLDKLLHGGDYNPEQWLEYPDVLEQDIKFFKKAKINVVTIGMFSWAKLEPEEGQYDIEWLVNIVDNLYKNGIYTILGTPSGARPKWLADRYPEVLRVNQNRVRNLFGGRHNHCYTSLIYRRKVWEINTVLAKKVGNHPGVLMLHLSNEYGGECHCPLCQREFKIWLQDRYSSITELNKKWNTDFWSHTYQDFEEIESPSLRGETMLHALNLDWKRFVTSQTVDFAAQEKAAFRKAGCEQPVTINCMGDYVGLNYRKFNDVIDIASWDSYPEWHRKPIFEIAIETGMQHDFMRSLLKKPFILMESSPSSTNWQDVSKLRKPGIIELAALQAVAHGADSALYFQLRQSRGASEKFHGAVIDHYGGEDSRVYQEVCHIGESLERLKELKGTKVNAKVAMIYDTENRWAIEDSQGPRNIGMPYYETAIKMYSAFRSQGLDVDILDEEDGFENYRILAVPMLYLFRENIQEKIRKFVRDGGILLMTFWSGIVDDTDSCFLGGTPEGLMDVVGVRSAEIDGLYDGEENIAVPVAKNSLSLSKKYHCEKLCELVKLKTVDTEVIMTYEQDFYSGMPALTCHEFGEGKAYYICADFEDDFYVDVVEAILFKEKIERIVSNIPKGVEVTTRESDKAYYIIFQNFNSNTVEINLKEEESQLLFGENPKEIQAKSTVIFKIQK